MAVGSLGDTPSINTSAKDTCFQGAFLLNNGCTMRGVVGPRVPRRRVGTILQLVRVVQVSEEHLHEDVVMQCKSKRIMVSVSLCLSPIPLD